MIVRKYGTSNVPNEFLKKSLSLVRYGLGTVRYGAVRYGAVRCGTSFTKVRENHCINLAKQFNGQVTNFNDWLVSNKDKILLNLAKKENH
jgi:hypothetical protein